jgi:hypothetical protein
VLRIADQQRQARRKQKPSLKEQPLAKQPFLKQPIPKEPLQKQLAQVPSCRRKRSKQKPFHSKDILDRRKKLVPEMPSATRDAVETILRHKFKRPETLWIALQVGENNVRHIVNGQTLPDGNMTMAMYGDGVLKLALLDYWYFDTEWSRCMYLNSIWILAY